MPLSWLLLGQVRASASSRARALESSRIEDLTSPDGAITYVAGGLQTKGALPVKTKRFDAALYCSRGRGYARYNEDAAELFADARGNLYASVFDQAGGLGGTIRGTASKIAAEQTFKSFREIATGPGVDDENAAKAMIGGFERAHHALVERAEGEVTTGVAVIMREGVAIVINSGDSGALHFGHDGKMKAMTVMHEHDAPIAAGCLTHAIGLIPESAAPDAYRWTLERGDWVLLCTDGLLDAGMNEDEIGGHLLKSENAENAVNRVCTRVLRLMTMMRAKPDNLTLIAIHVVS